MISAAEIEIQDGVWPCEEDRLERAKEIVILSPMLLNMPSPAVMALDAPWGQGKTTFIRLWQAYLKTEQMQFASFNAWESDFAEDPLIPLIATLDKWISANNPDTNTKQLWDKAKKLMPGLLKSAAVAAGKAVTLGSLDIEKEYETLASELLGGAIGDLVDSFNVQAGAIEQFQKGLIAATECLPEAQPNLIVFIDELDRCRPTYAIELLERIKHLFNIPRIVFVLGMDSGQLAESIKAVYGQRFDAKSYLNRFFDFDYKMKPADTTNFTRAILNTPEFKTLFGGRRDSGSDIDHMVKTIGGLAERFRMDLRSIGQLIFRIRMVMAGVKQNHILDAPLIAALIVLRLQNRKLYEEYIANPACAPDVINYLVEGMPEKFRYSNNMAIIEAYLIAGDSSLIEYKVCAEMLAKYMEIVGDQSLKDYEGIRYHADRVVRITDSLRGHSGGTAGSRLAFERIELISNIRA